MIFYGFHVLVLKDGAKQVVFKTNTEKGIDVCHLCFVSVSARHELRASEARLF